MLTDGDKMLAGPYDVVDVARDLSTGRYHVCIWREAPLPGETPPDALVRQRSWGHHTPGVETWAEVLAHVKELRENFVIDDRNVWVREEIVLPVPDTSKIGGTRVVPNWRLG